MVVLEIDKIEVDSVNVAEKHFRIPSLSDMQEQFLLTSTDPPWTGAQGTSHTGS